MPEQRPVLPLTVNTDLRPFRVAFLLRDDDEAAAARAMRAASAIWGGWRSPLIVVGEDGQVSAADRALLDLLRCDTAVNLSGSADRQPVWPNLGAVLAGGSGGPEVLDDPDWWPLHPIAFPAAYPAGQERFRYAVPVELAGGVPTECGGVPGLWALAAVGGPWNSDDVAALERAGVELGVPREPADLVLAQIGRKSLLSTTTVHDVDEDISAGLPSLLSELVLTVLPERAPDEGQNGALREVTTWWNSRAVRPVPRDQLASMSLVAPVGALEDLRVVHALRNGAQTVAACSPTVFLLAGPGASTEDLARASALLDLPEFSGTYRDHMNPPPGWEPTIVKGEDPSQRWQIPRVSGLRSTLPAVLTPYGTPARYVPPVSFEPGYLGRVALRVSGRTVTGPRRPQVAALHLRGGRWDGPGSPPFSRGSTKPTCTSERPLLPRC